MRWQQSMLYVVAGGSTRQSGYRYHHSHKTAREDEEGGVIPLFSELCSAYYVYYRVSWGGHGTGDV